jgi:TatD DNase family protein
LPGLIDSHCHLQHPAFDSDRDAVIDRAQHAGIVRILVPGWDLASSEAALELGERHPELVAAAVGVHPHHAAEADEAAWARLELLAADARVAAVGEIGLDFFRNLSPPEVQREAFARQLDLARRVGKPVLVHDRDAHEAITATLLTWAGSQEANGDARPDHSSVAGVLHCFSGDAAMAVRLAGHGFLVSFALPVSFHSAVGPRSAALGLPDDVILVETDAPWLGLGADRRNEPTTALRVAAELARLRGTTADEIARAAHANLRRLLQADAIGA